MIREKHISSAPVLEWTNSLLDYLDQQNDSLPSKKLYYEGSYQYQGRNK
jgi:hypothetical protein